MCLLWQHDIRTQLEIGTGVSNFNALFTAQTLPTASYNDADCLDRDGFCVGRLCRKAEYHLRTSRRPWLVGAWMLRQRLQRNSPPRPIG